MISPVLVVSEVVGEVVSEVVGEVVSEVVGEVVSEVVVEIVEVDFTCEVDVSGNRLRCLNEGW